MITMTESKIYSESSLTDLRTNKVPEHVAIIMDGNRRWAHRNGMPIHMGHLEGAERLRNIVKAAAEIGIKTLTVYSFSTENRNRSAAEIKLLFTLFKKYLNQESPQLKKNGIKLETIGDTTLFPADIQKALKKVKEETQSGTTLNLVLAMNYGGRDEMRRAVQKIFDENKGKDSLEVTEDLISQSLDTCKWKDPDLLIRTSGECRLSNFLLWQLSYSEIYFSKQLWPDFSADDLLEAVRDYQKREIRRGV